MLKQAFIITAKTISNKRPFSFYLILVTLLFVYTSFYTVNGISDFLTAKLVTHWLKDRPHFIFKAHNCDAQTTEALTATLFGAGYRSLSVCSRAALVTALRKSPGEPRLSRVIAVEYQPDYLQQIRFKTSYQYDIKTYIGRCLEELGGDVLLEGRLSKDIKSTQCDLDYEAALPVIAIGQKLARSLSNGPGKIPSGTTLHLYKRVLLTDFLTETPDHAFVVASVFETGFEDLDNLIIGPTGFLASLVPARKIEHLMQVKIQEVASLDDLRKALSLIKENKNLSQHLDLEYSITDDEIREIQDFALKTTAVMTGVVHILVYLVLFSGLSQFIEANRKLLALMRISGLQFGAIWLFLLMITLASVTLVCVASYLLSFLVSEALIYFIEQIGYLIQFKVLFETLVISLVVALLITVALKRLHFSSDIAKELEYAKRND
jgi:ABC-type lipoprotein release transport system permease subunit